MTNSQKNTGVAEIWTLLLVLKKRTMVANGFISRKFQKIVLHIEILAIMIKKKFLNPPSTKDYFYFSFLKSHISLLILPIDTFGHIAPGNLF